MHQEEEEEEATGDGAHPSLSGSAPPGGAEPRGRRTRRPCSLPGEARPPARPPHFCLPKGSSRWCGGLRSPAGIKGISRGVLPFLHRPPRPFVPALAREDCQAPFGQARRSCPWQAAL